MAKMVNFEGKMVPYDTLPHGCLFIRGVWYASENALPEEFKTQYGKLFAQMALSAAKTPADKQPKVKDEAESTKKDEPAKKEEPTKKVVVNLPQNEEKSPSGDAAQKIGE